MSLIRGLRQRHSAELDFRTEAENLAEVGANLRSRGFEPAFVRVPTVPDARLCTRHVLAMEYLHGQSLASAIEDEYAEIADALGIGSAAELRTKLMRRVQAHFEGGGGAQRFVETAEAAAPLVRAYARLVRWRRSLVASIHGGLAWAAGWLMLSHLVPPPSETRVGSTPDRAARSDLGRAIRTLVRVHGVAMLLDGVYNADPHPGNVLLLPDGKLGLIDYGMVGRLDPAARATVARVVLGLESGDQASVVGEYERAGYRACWHSGERHDAAVVFRFATFHLDRINLAPVAARPGEPPMPVMSVLRSTIEHSVPDWVEQARRLGGLLIGVGSQAGRPISLAHEWAPIAREALASAGDEPMARGATVRLRTHLTGLQL